MQAMYRGAVLREDQRVFVRKSKAVVGVQKMARGRRGRRQSAEMRTTADDGARKRRQEEDEARRGKAAVGLQRVARGRRGRRMSAEKRKTINKTETQATRQQRERELNAGAAATATVTEAATTEALGTMAMAGTKKQTSRRGKAEEAAKDIKNVKETDVAKKDYSAERSAVADLQATVEARKTSDCEEGGGAEEQKKRQRAPMKKNGERKSPAKEEDVQSTLTRLGERAEKSSTAGGGKGVKKGGETGCENPEKAGKVGDNAGKGGSKTGAAVREAARGRTERTTTGSMSGTKEGAKEEAKGGATNRVKAAGNKNDFQVGAKGTAQMLRVAVGPRLTSNTDEGGQKAAPPPRLFGQLWDLRCGGVLVDVCFRVYPPVGTDTNKEERSSPASVTDTNGGARGGASNSKASGRGGGRVYADVWCHRVVLAAAGGPALQDLLVHDPPTVESRTDNGGVSMVTVILPDTFEESFTAFVELLYCGEASITLQKGADKADNVSDTEPVITLL